MVALGVCELYDVADPTEKLYFESFWRPKTTKGKASTRWDILAGKSKNPGLIALYSQATDVQSQGEWSIFKAWRNGATTSSTDSSSSQMTNPVKIFRAPEKEHLLHAASPTQNSKRGLCISYSSRARQSLTSHTAQGTKLAHTLTNQALR